MAEGKTTSSKPKGTRKVKPVYVVLSVVDAAGNSVPLTSEQVTVHGAYKDSDELLTMLDAGSLPEGSCYKRIALA